MLNIPSLYKGSHYPHLLPREPLVEAVFRVKVDTEFLQPFLKDLKEAGYKKVWIGVNNPHWKKDMWESMIVGYPSISVSCGLALWRIFEKYAKMGCGNGLGEADQLQGPGWLYLVEGEYEL